MPNVGAPSLDHLSILVAIAETGSFSAASRCLHRTQSVVSYAVAQLEEQLGVPLFDRAGRTPVLTDAGRAVLADARRITQAVGELRARAAAMQQGLEAEISLAVDVLFPVQRLVDALRDVAREFPTVALRLRIEAIGSVPQLVLSRACVLGIAGWACTQSDALRRRPIGHVALIPVAAAGHKMAQTAPVPRALAQDQVQLVLADASRLTEGQDFGVVSAKTWRLGDLGAKHALLRAGLGWGNMPDHLVAAELATGELVRLAIEGEESEHRYPIFLIERADTPPGRAANWLKEKLAEK